MNALYTWKKEDPIRPVDYPGAICFLYSVYMKRVVIVPSARIFRAKRQEDPSTRKILIPCKLPSL